MKNFITFGAVTLALCIVRMIWARGTFGIEAFMLIAWAVWAIAIYRREVRT